MQKATQEKLPVALALTLALAGPLLFVVIDTANWRAARSEARHFLIAWDKASVAPQTDHDRFEACKGRPVGALEFIDDVDNTAEERSCILDALPKTQTTMGAIAGAQLAKAWLAKNPQDEAVRSAALKAIENGRADLLREKPWYDTVEQIDRLHDESVVLRTLFGQQSGFSLRQVLQDQLVLEGRGLHGGGG